MFALLVLAGCELLRPGMPAPTGGPSAFDARPQAPLIRLTERLDEAQIELPPGGTTTGNFGEFDLSDGWKQGKDEEGRAWRIESPIDLHVRRPLSQPPGIRMMQGTQEIPFNCPPRLSYTSWCYIDGDLQVGGNRNPSERKPPIRLVADRVADTLKRMDPALAGLAPAEFAHYAHTAMVGDAAHTYDGLALPAPTRITWTLALPEGARLDLVGALIDLGVREGPRSDGARLVVEVNGEVRLDEEVAPRPEPLQVDLSDLGGQTVTLTLRSEAEGEGAWDWVFAGAPVLTGAPPGGPRRIVVVGMDTTRWTNWTQNGHPRDTTSAMDAYAGGAQLFDNAWAPAPRTRPSFRTATTGRLPLPAMDGPTIGEVLGEAGFATAGVTANVHLVPRFGFNEGFDTWIYQNGTRADVEVRRAKAWLSDHRDRDALLFLHFMDPHVFYDAPLFFKNRFVRSKPGPLEWWMNRWQVVGLRDRLSDENKRWLQERYDGEMAYMARYLADFLAWAHSLPGQTLTVVHSDHGEEFFEHGSYEHNHTLYSELVHAMLWWRTPAGTPGGPTRSDALVALQDIAPTLYDFAGLDPSAWPPTDGLSLRPMLDPGRAGQLPALLERLSRRALPIGHLMYDTERWAVVSGDHKYILRTAIAVEELYDLRADPGEQKNLADTTSRAELDRHLARLAEATGWPAGPGWRLQILGGSQPFTLQFAAPIDALVLDPESASPRRANVEWGEPQAVLPEEVGTLSFSEDRRALTFTPGTHGRGLIAIRTGDWQATATLLSEGASQAIPAEGGTVSTDALRLRVTPGPVILPLDTTLNHLRTAAAGDADAMEALRALGYVE